jgi:hypothetical protein
MLGNLLVSHEARASGASKESRCSRERVERVDVHSDIRRMKREEREKLTTRGPTIYAQNDPNAR